MTISNNPTAQEKAQQETFKIEEVQSQLDYSIQSSNALATLYTNNIARVETLKRNRAGVRTGPWLKVSQGDSQNGAILPQNELGTDNIFNYILNTPLSLVYNNPDSLERSLSPKTIPNIKTIDYSEVFNQANLEKIEGPQGVKALLNQATTQLNGFSTTGFQEALTKAKQILTEDLFEDVKTLRDIIDVASSEINNPQSPIYKGPNAYGPFSTNQIAQFALPEGLIEIRNSCNSILGEIRNLFTILDKLLNIPEDILARAALSNAGLTQSPTDPNVFNAPIIEEKDPWGIKFSYNKITSGQVFAQTTRKNPTRSNTTLTPFIEETDSTSYIEQSNGLLNSSVSSKRDFYFQLLPAIKSNLPVSAGTDVPGAMPGIQFRIENNIVKHKIPGFAPVYQPMGIDSIKCTLVGMFSGNDGVDISSSFSDDINTGLLAPGGSLFSNSTSKTPTANSSDTKRVDGADLPIPSDSKSKTNSNIAVLSEDAFRGAQDFYNEIVAPGHEIEVELNLRKSSGPLDFTGGSAGPFRDATTGNPKFKALIKRLDLYYVRRDRCWFILDLEVTESGLLGTECINLTNIIEQATEVFEAVEDAPIGLTKEELDKCFKDPKTFIFKGEGKAGTAIVIDQATGLSYEYNVEKNALLTDKVFPTSTRDTLNIIAKEYRNFKTSLINKPGVRRAANKSEAALQLIVNILLNTTDNVQKNPADSNLAFATNKIKLNRESLTTTDRYALYDFNSGVFYSTNAKHEIKGTLFNRDTKLGTLKDIAKDIEYGTETQDGKIDNGISFLLNEYFPKISLKPTSCDDVIKNKIKATKKTDEANEPNNPLETSLNTQSSNSTNLNQTNFYTPSEKTTKEEKIKLDEKLTALKTEVEAGSLDRFLEDGINQYISLLQNKSGPTNSLSPALSEELLKEINAGNLSIDSLTNNTPIKLTVSPKKSILDCPQSNEQELLITVGYDVNDSFTIRTKDSSNSLKSRTIYKNRTVRIAEVIIKAYSIASSNTILYKIDGITIDLIAQA